MGHWAFIFTHDLCSVCGPWPLVLIPRKYCHLLAPLLVPFKGELGAKFMILWFLLCSPLPKFCHSPNMNNPSNTFASHFIYLHHIGEPCLNSTSAFSSHDHILDLVNTELLKHSDHNLSCSLLKKNFSSVYTTFSASLNPHAPWTFTFYHSFLSLVRLRSTVHSFNLSVLNPLTLLSYQRHSKTFIFM